jgi:hypothetical protein
MRCPALLQVLGTLFALAALLPGGASTYLQEETESLIRIIGIDVDLTTEQGACCILVPTSPTATLLAVVLCVWEDAMRGSGME